MTAAASQQLREELERGLTLPASWYSDPVILEREHDRIFRRSWQYAGPLEQVAEPGAFLTGQAGDTPVVVVRNHGGELKGFVNVCRHRGHLVASGCGRRETLQCPYHAWTYDLDGALRAAPRSEREAGFDHADWSLQPVHVASWGPLVFVNPDIDAAPFTETIGDIPAGLAAGGVDPGGFEYRGRSRELLIHANWKIVVENFLECYHCPVAHTSFSTLLDVDPDAYTLSTARWSSSQHARVRTGDGRKLPYVPSGEIDAGQFHYVWPNWTLNTLPGPPHVRVLVFQPVDAQRTATYVDGFWAPGTPDEIVEDITAFGAVVGKEDVELVESVHRGLRSGAIEQGRLLLGSERLLQHFQLLVHDAVAD
jgi:phenylpropionate dioxygenase-like ring-hydroxylating dioxygenase large terminal subunit